MRLMHHLTFALPAWLLAAPALACFPVPIPVAERAREAQLIAAGEVVAIRPGVAREYREDGDALTVPGPYTASVRVNERLKGEAGERLEVAIPDCGAGKAELHERVLVFATGKRWYVMKDEAEARARITAAAAD